MALPTPKGRQKEVLCLPPEGHVVVLGTAGSGKTTLAILRAEYLAHPSNPGRGNVLLVTFNRALVTYLRHLKGGHVKRATVENYHTFARGYLASQGRLGYGDILDDSAEKQRLIRKAVRAVEAEEGEHPLLERSVSFFENEISWIARHGLRSTEDYTAAERIGQESRVTRANRPLMYQVFESYRRLRGEAGYKYDWDDMAMEVSDAFEDDDSDRLYRHVVIDEGQDFSPEMIRSLVRAVSDDGSVTFFGDVAQQIYGHRMSWRSAGLDIRKVWKFEENYRNSREIARLAVAISNMPYYEDAQDIVEPTEPTAEGPPPTLVQCDSVAEQARVAAEQAKDSADTNTVAVITRTWELAERISARLPHDATRLYRDLRAWKGGPGIYWGTFHSAKGIEFDTVIIPFLDQEVLPNPQRVATEGEEAARRGDGRLLYVGVTRARHRLIMLYSSSITDLMPEADDLYKTLELEAGVLSR